MKKKKTRLIGMLLLSIFIIWSAYNTLVRIFFIETTSDVLIANSYGLLWLLQILAFLSIVASLFCLFALKKRSSWGIKSIWTLFSINIFIILFIAFLSFLDTEIAKEAVEFSRSSRDLKTVEDIDSSYELMAFTGFFFYALLYGFLIKYVHKKRDYFSK